jgi:hypothetical protein
MKGRIQGRRAKWLRVAFAVAVGITAHALNGGSAQAATIDSTSFGAARIAAAGDASAPQTIVLAGFTSQRYPGFFKISGDGRMLLGGAIAISMTCTSGDTVVVTDAFARVRIHADGRLHAAYSSPTFVTNGTTYQGTDAMTATLNPKHSQLTGTWRLAVNYGFADGTSDQCASGPVRFKLTSS